MTRSARLLVLLACLTNLGFSFSDRATGDERHGSDPALPKRMSRVGEASSATGNTTTSLTVDVSATGVAVGRRLVARFTTGTASGPVSASDSRGNVWSVDADHSDTQRNIRVVVLSAKISTALTDENAITFSFPPVFSVAVVVDEFTGLGSPAVVQKTFRSGTSPIVSSGTVATALPNALLIGLIATRGTATVNFQAGSGWTAEPGGQAGSRRLLPEYRVAPTGGTLEANGSLGADTEWAAVMVEYRAAQLIPTPTAPEPTRQPVIVTAPTTPTFTDLTLNVAKQVLDGPDAWVTQIALGVPEALTFRWSRPALRAGATTTTSPRLALTDKAQYQMVVASTPTSNVVFLPSAEKGASGLPMYAFYSYGPVAVAPSGSTADFTIPAAKLPTPAAPATIWVRVVLSTSSKLQGSPWVKVAMVKNDDPLKIDDPLPYPTPPVWIRLTEIECIRETADDSPEDEIFAVVVSADLKSGKVKTRISPVYDFDQQNASQRVRATTMTVWGPDLRGLPAPIIEPDAAVVIAELIERDEDDSPASAEATIQSALAAKLAQMLTTGLSRSEMALQLHRELRDKVVELFKDQGDDIIGFTAGPTADHRWNFSLAELQDVVTGKVVTHDLTFARTWTDQWVIAGDDQSLYKVRFEIGKQGVKWE